MDFAFHFFNHTNNKMLQTLPINSFFFGIIVNFDNFNPKCCRDGNLIVFLLSDNNQDNMLKIIPVLVFSIVLTVLGPRIHQHTSTYRAVHPSLVSSGEDARKFSQVLPCSLPSLSVLEGTGVKLN